MAKNLMICGDSASRLNESVSDGRYIMEGVFAGPLDGTKNRNGRIYTVEEYLKHLSYLRDDIRTGELLGCLDHPDIFDVKLKEASHRILDIWYDEKTKCIMGKIQLLDTPNGKIAKELVDAGIPLHISSRASGNVNKDGTVSIQQIFTFDIVCKSGFKDAILHRVTESLNTNKYSTKVMNFLTESERAEANNLAKQYGFVNEGVCIHEVEKPVKLRKEAKKIQEEKSHNDNMKKNINENAINIDDAIENSKYVVTIDIDGDVEIAKLINETSLHNEDVTVICADGQVWFCYDTPDAFEIPEGFDFEYLKGFDADGNIIENPDYVADDTDESVKESDGDDDEKNDDSDDKSDDKKDDDKDDDKSGVEIIDVRMEGEDDKDDDVDIKDVKSDDDDKDKDNDKSDDDKDDENKADECNGPDCKKADPKKDMIVDCKDIKDRKEKFDDKFADLVDTIKRRGEKKAANESTTINKYPISSLLNKSNFKKFMGLNESQKSKVVDYLKDNGMISVQKVNENWENGVDYESPSNEMWIKNAPDDYKELYENADAETRRSIKNTAKYVIFENQGDVNRFWEGTGLMTKAEKNMIHEQFINNLPKVTAVNENISLPYSKGFIEAIGEMARSYNNN